MNDSLTAFTLLYQTALRAHLTGRARPNHEVTGEIGDHARKVSLSVQEFARIHEDFLVKEMLPGLKAGKHDALMSKAGRFFAAAVAAAQADARDGAALAIETLSARNVRLAMEITRHGELEAALRTSESDLRRSLAESEEFKGRLRDLSRQILSDQEEQRKRISRELHDVVAQTLAMINLRLALLKTDAGIDTKRLTRNISLTQKMVTKSAESVYQFARELRPAALDDLGLIPALHSFLIGFTKRTGVRTQLTVFKGLDKLSAVKRTVIYRITQEAINNVGLHARAELADVRILREGKFLHLVVADDGISFHAGQPPLKKGQKRLGLLGMKEREEMIGGFFEIESAPG